MFLSFLIFLFGLSVGSFLNCLIYRLEISESLEGRPRRKTSSFLRGRSFCPHCKHELAWQDLIPLLSFFLVKGKCRYCQKPISWQYPLVELATALLFILIMNQELGIIVRSPTSNIYFQNLLLTIYYLLITCFLIIIFVFDLKHFIIPDQIIYPAIVITFLYNLLDAKYLILNAGPSAILASGFFLLIYLLSQGKWLGFGDVKLAFFMGLFLGFPKILVALFLSFFVGAAVGLIQIALGKKTLKSEVPFGPFLISGTLISLFWSQGLINWYLNLLYL